MFDDLFKDIFRRLSRPNFGMAHWLLEHCVTLQRRLEADPNIPEKVDIQKVIELCVTAVKRMRDGFHYDLDYPGDPVRQAVDAVTPYFPDEDKIQLPDDKVRSRALTAAIETLNQSAGSTGKSTKLPITATICRRAPGSQQTTSETLSYSLSVGGGYTLDDLLFVIRLHHPTTLTKHPYLYSRPVNAHCHTQQGSKFEWKKESDSLKGLARTGPLGSGAVYLVIPENKFILLVEGVPLDHEGGEGATQDDKVHIVDGLNDPITSQLGQSKDRTRTFHHHSEAWEYSYRPNRDADITWKDLMAKRRLKLFRGEWIACVE
ncbi:hypothetical protein FRC04_007514 [Tulasnella sp. 424]|nr:hypothetical protein FRC04_007514 [Tulasnella sp. 424]